MPQLFANNAKAALGAALTISGTSLTLQTGQGTLFPTISNSDDFFLLTLYKTFNNTEYNHEIVKVSAKSGDVLTIVRAQEGTTARAWDIGSYVSCRVTANTMANIRPTTLGTSIPVTIGTGVSTYTVPDNAASIICQSSSCTITLPSASSNIGRIIFIRNQNIETDYSDGQLVQLTSASTNIYPLYGTTLTSTILDASVRKFCIIQSDGTNWIVLAAN